MIAQIGMFFDKAFSDAILLRPKRLWRKYGPRQNREIGIVKKTSSRFSTLQTAGAAPLAPENRRKPHEKQKKCVFMQKKRPENLP